MEYDQVHGSYEDLQKALEPFVGTRIILPFSDAGAAVFGFRVLDEGSGYEEAQQLTAGLPDAEAAEIEAKRAEAVTKSKLHVWKMFGRDLSSSVTETSSLAELNRYHADHPGSKTWMLPDGHLAVLDYSQAGEGKSVVVRMTAAAYNASPVEEKQATRGLYPSYGWPAILGLEPAPQRPNVPGPVTQLRSR